MNYQNNFLSSSANLFFVRLKQLYQRYQFPLLLAICLRIGLSLWFAFIALVIDPYFPRDANILEGAYHYIMLHSTFLGKALLDIWLRYDAIHYINIATVGYAALEPGDLNFPPLYPYLTRLFSLFTFGEATFAGLLVSTPKPECAASAGAAAAERSWTPGSYNACLNLFLYQVTSTRIAARGCCLLDR
jgi:hypothetical protein